MNLDLTKNIYNKMASHQFVMSVMGNFNQDLLKSLIKMAERKLDSLATEDSVKKKLFHFMVECAQNLCRLNSEQPFKTDKLFLIGKQAQNYVIYIGAVFSAAQVETIKAIVDKVNKLENGEVKNQFYAELSQKELDSQNPILMSLLDISKRTKEKIHYDVTPINQQNSFLAFKTSISEIKA